MMPRLVLSFALFASSLVACSAADIATPPPPDTAVVKQGLTIAEFCAATDKLFVAWCAYKDRCCTLADQHDDAYIPVLCPAPGAAECEKSLDEVLKKKHFVYHPEHAQACIDAKVALVPAPPRTCEGTRATDIVATIHHIPAPEQIRACRQTFAGTLLAGDVCEYNFDCAEPLRCRNASPSQFDYRCAPAVKSGEACHLDGDCGDEDEQCIGGLGREPPHVCSKLRTAGQGCGFDTDCVANLECSNTQNVCVSPGQPGGTCDGTNGYSCAGFATCNAETHSCEALKDVGEACTSSYECQGRCDASTKTCVAMCGGAH